jgi:hypothetical protein
MAKAKLRRCQKRPRGQNGIHHPQSIDDSSVLCVFLLRASDISERCVTNPSSVLSSLNQLRSCNQQSASSLPEYHRQRGKLMEWNRSWRGGRAGRFAMSFD